MREQTPKRKLYQQKRDQGKREEHERITASHIKTNQVVDVLEERKREFEEKEEGQCTNGQGQ